MIDEGTLSKVEESRKMDSMYCLLHTRFTTQGSIQNNGNNHPVVRDGIILTHNGVIQDRPVYRHFDVTPIHQVDTEAIIVGLRHSNPTWVAENIQGSMSIAWVDCTKSTSIVNLMTNGRNPLVIARLRNGDIVYASCEYHLEEFDISHSFNAVPFKVYKIDSETGIIRSEFISDMRTMPSVHRPFTHAASYGNYVASTETKWGVTSSTPKRTPQKASKKKKKGTGRREPKNPFTRAQMSDLSDWESWFDDDGEMNL